MTTDRAEASGDFRWHYVVILLYCASEGLKDTLEVRDVGAEVSKIMVCCGSVLDSGLTLLFLLLNGASVVTSVNYISVSELDIMLDSFKIPYTLSSLHFPFFVFVLSTEELRMSATISARHFRLLNETIFVLHEVLNLLLLFPSSHSDGLSVFFLSEGTTTRCHNGRRGVKKRKVRVI